MVLQARQIRTLLVTMRICSGLSTDEAAAVERNRAIYCRPRRRRDGPITPRNRVYGDEFPKKNARASRELIAARPHPSRPGGPRVGSGVAGFDE